MESIKCLFFLKQFVMRGKQRSCLKYFCVFVVWFDREQGQEMEVTKFCWEGFKDFTVHKDEIKREDGITH